MGHFNDMQGPKRGHLALNSGSLGEKLPSDPEHPRSVQSTVKQYLRMSPTGVMYLDPISCHLCIPWGFNKACFALKSVSNTPNLRPTEITMNTFLLECFLSGLYILYILV